MMTIDQINNNPIFAPIGNEEEFKRRLFLDNFQRCMTIREFQKTAGVEIKKKVLATKPALAMKEMLDWYHNKHRNFLDGVRDYQLPTVLHLTRLLPYWMIHHGSHRAVLEHKVESLRMSKLYCTKSSNYETIVKSKEQLYLTADRYYQYKIKTMLCGYDDKIYRIGFWNYFNIIVFVFIKHYKKFAKFYGSHSERVFLGALIKCYDLETKTIKWNNDYGFNLPETKIDIVL